jgi:ankyrin repeat protein
MNLLASRGIDVFSKHKETGTNALHVAVQRKHFEVSSMLIDSGFPLNLVDFSDNTALIISSSKKESNNISMKLISAGADINYISKDGACALSEAVNNDNSKLVNSLIHKGGKIFFEDQKLRDYSPFFMAINKERVWAIEMFCDHGADTNTTTANGQNCLLYAATRGYDNIAMYLCLRTKNIDHEDSQTGINIFTFYLMKQDLKRMKQVLMRGSDINYSSSKGQTALYYAITNRLPERVVKFLIKYGANPHIEDIDGKDCCDKAKGVEEYSKIPQIDYARCKINPLWRTTFHEAQI